RSIVEDQKGDLWFGSLGGGVSQFDGKTFTHYTEKEGLSNNNVRSICEDQHGNIWIGTWGGGIDKFNGQAFSHYGEKEGLSNNYIRSILADKNGNLWIGTAGGGVNKFHGNAFTHFKKDQGLKNNIVRSILEDQSGKLWFGTWGDGISRYDGNTFMQYTLQEGLPSNFIVVSLEDKEGNLWFGTRGEGVIRYDGKYFTHFTENDGLSDNYVMSILEDRKGHLWFGTLEGGVTRYDGVSFTRISKKEGLSGNTVWSIIEDKEGNIWFSTWGGGVTKYNGTLFTHFSEKEGLFNNEIWSMLEDSRGNLWFGTNGSGVIKYDGHYFTQYTTREGLSNNVVRSILEDHENNLWFGTEMGLNKMSNRLSTGAFLGEQPQDTKELNNILFSFYNYEDGFMGLDCNPNALFEDSKNNLWIGTNDRLSMYQKPQGEIYLDTLTPNIQLTSIQLFNEDIPWLYLEENKDSNFLLENGVEIDQLKFSETSRWYGIPQQLQLPYDNNFLTFSFVGITTNSPKKVKYQYQLEGIDVNWNTLTSRTEASYGNLSHGDYLFKVKARNSSGYFSKTYEYRFSISPPWWHTWWARFIFVIVPGLLFITFYRIRVTLLKSQKLTLEKQVKDRTTQLLQQNEDLRALNKEKDGILGIVAHDLRAPFHRIKGLLQLISYEGKFEKEQFDYVDKINMNIDQGNQIIRDLLDVSNYQRDSLYIEKDIVVIEDFLNELKEYFGPLAKSKQQPLKFISKATSLLNTDKILLFRVMENLVSNAIKFSPPGKPIQVTAWEEHTRFYFSIKDNGPGFSKEDKEKMFGKFQKLSAQPTGNEGSTGLGLSIVKIIVERLHGSVEVFSEPKKGAEFIVSLKKS
ncbi:MAG: ATP-binding protein, partial [Cyclobacteriaceae bacterium]|nr:ATP-binding protein [Cyclobacteriaceae bacterium]